MPVDGGCREVFVGGDPVAHAVLHVAPGERLRRLAMGQATLGQEPGRDHDPVMVPRLILLCQIPFHLPVICVCHVLECHMS